MQSTFRRLLCFLPPAGAICSSAPSESLECCTASAFSASKLSCVKHVKHVSACNTRLSCHPFRNSRREDHRIRGHRLSAVPRIGSRHPWRGVHFADLAIFCRSCAAHACRCHVITARILCWLRPCCWSLVSAHGAACTFLILFGRHAYLKNLQLKHQNSKPNIGRLHIKKWFMPAASAASAPGGASPPGALASLATASASLTGASASLTGASAAASMHGTKASLCRLLARAVRSRLPPAGVPFCHTRGLSCTLVPRLS